MRRCRGITRNLRSCGRRGDWRFFCADHRRQPIVWAFVFVFTVGGGLSSILGLLNQNGRAEFDSQSERAALAKRARVLFVESKLLLPEDDDGQIVLAYGLMNYGDADAIVTLQDFTYYFTIDPEKKVFEYQETAPQEIQLAAIPNAMWRGEARLSFELTPTKRIALDSGQARLFFLYARGQYHDASGTLYPLPFTGMYDGTFPGHIVACPRDVVFR